MQYTKQNQIVRAAFAAAILAAAGGTASADVLLSDNFNTGANGTVDSFNGGAGARQGGSLAGTGYTSKMNWQNVNGDQVLFQTGIGGLGRLFINHDFTDSAITSAGGFTVSYSFVPSSSASGSDTWLGLMFGQTSAFVNTDNWYQVLNSGSDFGVILRGNGGYQAFNAGGGAESGATLLNYDVANEVKFTVLTTSFSAGALATISASVNGSAIDLNGAAIGNDRSITWDADAANYIQFEANGNNVYRLDNLEIATVVPEPATMTLAGLGLALLVIRRRSR